MEQFYDVNIKGEINEEGRLEELWGADAVKNAIIMWLTSYRSDYLRSPTKGGYLTSHLYKKMSSSTQEDMYDSIVDGFNQEFDFVELVNLQVTPNYDNNFWSIFVEVYIPFLDSTVEISENIRNLV
ncbi:hypothetical protein M0Q39_06540 [Patescibacteria group bacterium]|nr:hypothetical protein [Patescibacteria group bacterium]